MWDLGAFTLLDLAGVAVFLAAWLGYGFAVQRRGGRRSLSRVMHDQRRIWADQMIERDNRVVDTTINASLQNGTAFFASTSLIALGSVLTLTRSGDDVLSLFGTLPFGTTTTRSIWEVKVAGLAVIFVYAFFKFSWAYRLFNYGAILIGAVPPKDVAKGTAVPPVQVRAAAGRAAAMNIAAGNHFDRGQRAFFFALAYLGWFVSALVWIAATAAVVAVMWRRQFTSEVRAALIGERDEPETREPGERE